MQERLYIRIILISKTVCNFISPLWSVGQPYSNNGSYSLHALHDNLVTFLCYSLHLNSIIFFKFLMSSVLIWLLLSYWLQKAVPKLKCHSWFQPIKLAKCYQSSSLTQTGSLSSVPAAASRCKILPIIRPDVQNVPPPGFHTTKSCVLLWCWWMTTDDENKKTDFTQQKFDEWPFWNVLLWSFYLRVGIRFKFDSTLHVMLEMETQTN